jgi:hypothetical protein
MKEMVRKRAEVQYGKKQSAAVQVPMFLNLD